MTKESWRRYVLLPNKNGDKIPIGYAYTKGNHHALIYKNENGKYNDKVVPLLKAVAIGLQNLQNSGGKSPQPIIDRSDDAVLGKFLFSMQINDLFVFDLKPDELDFFDPANYAQISKKLFRVQKMSKSKAGRLIVIFRHHLETKVKRRDKNGKEVDEKMLKGIIWEDISSNKHLHRPTKVKINHIGQIIKIGEL